MSGEGVISASSKLSAIASVNAASISAAASASFAKPVAVACVGNTIYVPTYGKIAAKFQ